MPTRGQLDPDEELGRGDGRDRYVVIVGDRLVETAAPAFGAYERGRVEDQAVQSRSSVSSFDRNTPSSRSHSASGR